MTTKSSMDEAFLSALCGDNLSLDKTLLEQGFSVDGSKTWETNWIINATREKNELIGAASSIFTN